jgi:TRAP-type C4-dicarboxylate transport system permease small subunit
MATGEPARRLFCIRGSKSVQKYVSVVSAISRFLGVVSVALMVAALLSVCHMVVMRGILGQAVIWQTEFATFALVSATFLGCPYVLMVRGHVNVELLPLKAGLSARRVLAFVTAGAALLFCVAVLVNAVEWWWEAFEGGWTTDSIWRPRLWIYYLSLPVGMFFLSLQYIAEIGEVATGRAPPFGIRHDDKTESRS